MNNTNYTGEYISPQKATRIRIFQDHEGYAIDAADDDGNYTEKVWTHWDGELLSMESAVAHASDFAKEIKRRDLESKVYVSGKLARPSIVCRARSFLFSFLRVKT